MEYRNKDRIKILFVAHNFPPNWFGGVENYLKSFVTALSQYGDYEVSILYPEVHESYKEVDIELIPASGFNVFRMRHNISFPVLVDQYKEIFKQVFQRFFYRYHFDIIHFHHLMNYPNNLVKIAKDSGAEIFFTIHDFWFFCPKVHLFNEKKKEVCKGNKSAAECAECLLGKDPVLIDILNKRKIETAEMFKSIDYISVPSQFVKRKLIEYGIPNEIHVHPLGIKDKITHLPIQKKNHSGPITLGYLGSISHIKNIVPATRWFSEISTTMKFKIWGNGHAELIREIKEIAQSNENIEYMGSYSPDDLERIFSQVDILLIPSFVETFSIVLREALMYKIPALLSDIEVFREGFSNANFTIFFNTNDKNDFVKKIKILEENPEIITQMKEGIVKPMTIVEDVSKWDKVYKQNLSEGGVRNRVSIIIPLFNKLELTQNCIDALYANTEADLFELILVDNASSDGTTEYIKRIAEEKSNVKIIVNKENLGFAKANNQGAEIAQGEYLVTLNNDTIVKKGWLGSLLNIAENDKSVAAVGAKLLFPDNTIQHAGVVIVKNLQRNEPLIATHIFYQQDKNLKEVNTLLQYQVLTAGCLLIRKEAFFEVGGFDEIYWNGYEDVDLCFKLKQNNWQLVYQPKSEIIHFESQSGPERFSKNDENVEILVNRWLGKVYHDFVVESQDSVRETGAQITKYIPKPPRSVRASIIIVTYNSSGEILKNLSSVGNFMTREDEVIIVDNNSRDNTVEIIERFIEGRDNFRLLKNDKNLGFTVATNMGIKESGNNMIVLLNPDTVVTQNWLEKFEYHLRDENVMAVGPLSNYAAGLQNILAYLPEDEAAKLSASAINTILEENNRYKSSDTKLLIGFCIAVKRSFFEEYGLLDEDLFLGNDDLELSWRIRENGGTLKVALDTFIYHEGQKSFATEKKEKTEKLVQESANKLYRKLEKYYGKGRVPSSMELWGMEWFNPTNVNPLLSVPVTASIIIPVFNQIEYTLETIESIYRETEENFELILIDNGSDEKTAVPLQKLSDEKENVKVIRNDENLGFPKAINQGLRAAHGKYVVIANNDIVVTKGWLRKMIVHAESRPNIGIVGTISNKVSGVQLVKNAEYKTIDEMQKFAGKVETEMRGKKYEFPRVAFLCTLIKWRVVEKIGGLDERFSPGNYEDDDYCLRAQLAGFKTVIALDVFIHHYGSKSFTAEGNEKYARLLEENKRKFINKWGGTPDDIWLKGKKPFEREIAIPLRKTFVDYVNSANTALNSRKYEESLHNLEKAIESFDESSGVKITDLLMLASKIAKLLNQSEKAEKYLLKFIQIDDKNAETYNLLGVIFEEKEEYEKALGFYEQSLKLRDDIEIKRKTDKLKNNLITKS